MEAPRLKIDTGELVVPQGGTKEVFADTYFFEPDFDEKDLGYLGIVVEASGGSPDANARRTAALVDKMRDEYYRQPSRGMADSFEAMLRAANELLGIPEAREECIFQVGVFAFSSPHLTVARTGEVEILLVRRGRLSNIGKGLAEKKNMFSDIAEGIAAADDVLLLTTRRLLRSVPQNRLGVLVSRHAAKESVVLLEELLSPTAGVLEGSTRLPVACILARFTPSPLRAARRIPPSPAVGVAPQRYPAAEKVPAALGGVTPRQPLRFERSTTKRLWQLARRGGERVGRQIKERVLPRAVALSARGSKLAWAATQRAWHKSRTLIARVQQRRPTPEGEVKATPAFPPPISLKDKILARFSVLARLRTLPQRLFSQAGKFLRPAGWRSWWQNLAPNSRRYLILTATLAVLFGITLFLLVQKREREAEINRAAELLQRAELKIQSADTALIFDNETEARAALAEAEKALKELSSFPHYQPERIKQEERYQKVYDALNKVQRVKEPRLVSDIREAAGFTPTAFTGIEDKLYTFNPQNNTIVKINADGNTEVVSASSSGIGYFRHVLPLPDLKMLLFLTDSPGLALFDVRTNDLTPLELNPPLQSKEWSAVGTYRNRLYLWDTAAKQIMSYGKTLRGYAQGRPWLKTEKVKRDNIVDMAIDGYIYLLHADGKIDKLLKGAPVEFQQPTLSPSLKSPTAIFVTPAIKHLYILDANNRRVIVLDTVGNLRKQIFLDQLKGLRDLYVSADEKKLYLLAESRIYLVPLE